MKDFYARKADMLVSFAHLEDSEKQNEIILRNLYRLPAEMREAGYSEDEIFFLTGFTSALQ